ncbi:MAG TPA: steroid 3-ketoacyl-CoA thiolase, partial [Actinobacteria bacterium]|jgi:acetyl-CoA acetyltransferase family protein|nr:steroid 3-ketoacyl-CoA thiolase [Actinomycetota bacterium]HCP61055.1 steroid 3-ketoacyl-CoA thiolase [Actinomycetota bacterium]
MSEVREAVIVEAVRSPIGKRNGSLKEFHPVDLLAEVLKETVGRAGVDPGQVEDHITGCVSQVGEQSLNIGRNAWLAAGFPEEVPATTVDRQCGSSQQAIHFAAQGVMAGAYDLVVASGVENMSRVPMGSSTAGQNPFGQQLFARYEGKLVPQGISADLIASKWGITREDSDDFGFRSHVKAAAATKAGYFKKEILPLKVTGPEGEQILLDYDEGIRMEPNRERMNDLRPAFENAAMEDVFPGQLHWTVTAGNSSQISDGASSVIIASREKAEQLGLTPRARFVSFSLAGDSPILMLTGPIPATRKVLERAGLTLEDIDVVEINEAFASVVLAWQRELGVSDEWFDDHVNPNGGAIAVGHPLGATGAKLMTTMLHELERRGGRYGLQTMCEGGGMANATIIERLG